MTDFGRRSGVGDMLKATYDPNADGVIAVAQTEADMKRSVYDANLDGVIAVAQTEADMVKATYDPVINALVALAAAHKTQHQSGGTDEIDATGLTGVPVAPLLLDGTAGRVLRLNYFYVTDGTNVATVKVKAYNVFNGNVIAEVDNIAKGDTSGVFTMAADGQKLIVDAAAFSGNIKYAMIYIARSSSQVRPSIYAEKYGNHVRFHFYNHATSAGLDITTDIGVGEIRFVMAYITDA